MTYASVLVHVQTDGPSAAALECAIDVADRFDASLIGIGAQALPPPPFSDPATLAGDWVVAMREMVEKNLKAAGQRFRYATQSLSPAPIWECGMQLPLPAVARASRGADLIVAARPEHYDAYANIRPGDLVVESGRPVLVPPVNPTPLHARRILLAWKDTREARRALSDAMPFFKKAEEVLVLEVCHEDQAGDAKIRTDDVAAALARHGVTAQPRVVAHEPADAHQILRQANIFGADLVVAGGYGHSRLGELVFGGVTHDLLDGADRYVLLSH